MELTDDFHAHMRTSNKITAHRCDRNRNADSQNDSPPKGQPRQALHKRTEVEEEGKLHGKDRDP